MLVLSFWPTRQLASRERILRAEIRLMADRAEIDGESCEHIQETADDSLVKK